MTSKIIRFAMFCTGFSEKRVRSLYSEFEKKEEKPRTTPERIEEVVFSYFMTTKERVYNKSRKVPGIYYRQVIQYLMRNYTSLTDAQIGIRTGGFHRTTVMQGCMSVSNLVETNDWKAEEFDRILKKII